uniref:Uncharacterized protein n=1 Tax=Glossina pallidipes TaxID=7398 RepID=A0A1A9Z2S6_GLOPL
MYRLSIPLMATEATLVIIIIVVVVEISVSEKHLKDRFIHYLWKYVFMAVAFWLYTVYSHCSVNGSNDSYDNYDAADQIESFYGNCAESVPYKIVLFADIRFIY